MFNNIDLIKMANSVRILSLDMIQRAKSGHPGIVLGMADVITTLFANYLRFDIKNPNSDYRDRFVLSSGHGSAMLYSILHLVGYKISITDLQNFRQLGSITQGHPELNTNIGIETSTGPLGQGISTAVGMALAMKIKKARDSNYPNNYTYVIASDGDLMEGVSMEAISFAGHYKLNNLIVLWDSNNISIDGNTNKAISDNITERFNSANWDTIIINGNNISEIDKAIKKAKQNKKPTLIECKTKIGLYSKKEGTSSVHGSPLEDSDYLNIRKKLGYEKLSFFDIPSDIKKLWKQTGTKLPKTHNQTLKERDIKKEIDKIIQDFLDNPENIATRVSNQKILNSLTKKYNDILIGGSADLSSSVGTLTNYSIDITSKNYSGNYIHYGIKEHVMGTIMNGLDLSGFKAFGGTFLVFSDYMRPSIRMSALMKLPVIYIMTHDSIALGEDGATHQPIEHLTSLRAMPNINVFRPCDSIETAEAWELALSNQTTPSILSLTRQSLPQLRNKKTTENKTSYGGYVLKEAKGGFNNRKITLIATGSEVSLALAVQSILEKNKYNCAVISMPCCELFDKQSDKYRLKTLKTGDSFIIAIEAGSSLSWYKYADAVVGIDDFGTSGKGSDLMSFYGFDSINISNCIMDLLKC